MQVVTPRFGEPLILGVAKLIQRTSRVSWPPIVTAMPRCPPQ
jgi:hypothetical protein